MGGFIPLKWQNNHCEGKQHQSAALRRRLGWGRGARMTLGLGSGGGDAKARGCMAQRRQERHYGVLVSSSNSTDKHQYI
jgi:hypothetical protein